MILLRIGRSLPAFQLGMISIFLISLCLRFWGLSRFNTLVFDEIYYAKFGNNYLTQTPFFNAHPPLSQYLIAFGISIGSHLPFGQDTVNDLTGSSLSTWSYRWINAFTGSLIPLMIGAIAYQLTHRRSYTLIATVLMASDGLFLVESRYALSNLYIVFFGLIAHLFLILGLKRNGKQRWSQLILSGIAFGATIAVKWNGLGFLLGIIIFLIFAGIIQQFMPSHSTIHSPLQNFQELTWIQILMTLVIVPILTYILLWVPHLQQNPTPGLWELHTKILSFHRNLGDGSEIHPYCSKWYTWPLMIRPVAYFFEKVENLQQIDPSLPMIKNLSLPVIYDVHGMGNPFLLWLTVIAFFCSLWVIVKRIGLGFAIGWQVVQGAASSQLFSQVRLLPEAEYYLLSYLCINALTNWLPWAVVSRCTFFYHYMSTVGFAVLILAWWIERFLSSPQNSLRLIGLSLIMLIILAFFFWLPIYLGLPLTDAGWKLRMWFSSWI